MQSIGHFKSKRTILFPSKSRKYQLKIIFKSLYFFLGTLDEDTQEGMELEDSNADSEIPVEDFLEKIDPELFYDDKGGIISEDIFQFGPILKKTNQIIVPQLSTLGSKAEWHVAALFFESRLAGVLAKVRIFWEAHKIWKNLPHDLDVY